MKRPHVQTRNLVITGCSSGIGRATANWMKDRGWRVAATARKDEDIARLRDSGFETIHLDVADPASVDAAAEAITTLFDGVIGGVVSNAAYGQSGAIEDLTRSALADQFEVNVIGMQDFANRFIPAMRKQGWGRIVNISSVLGRVSMPYIGAYAATKFAMEALTDALRVEVTGSGIGVSLVEPGPIATEFRKTAVRMARSNLDIQSGRHADYYREEIERREGASMTPRRFTRPPEAVAEKICHALESSRPKRRYKVTPHAYAGAFMSRFAPPALLDRAAAMMVRTGK